MRPLEYLRKQMYHRHDRIDMMKVTLNFVDRYTVKEEHAFVNSLNFVHTLYCLNPLNFFGLCSTGKMSFMFLVNWKKMYLSFI